MSHIMVLGLGPLPTEPGRHHFAPGIRTLQFSMPLLEDGHRVTLITNPFGIGSVREPGEPVIKEDRENFHYIDCPLEHDGYVDYVRKIVAERKPDALVGAGSFLPAHAAVMAAGDLPVWADINGCPMAEAQARAEIDADDDRVLGNWSRLAPVLHRADKFSTVSGPQRYALIGMLAAVGRLNQYTNGYNLVHVVPNGNDGIPESTGKPFLRGRVVPEDAVVVLWSGGFNTWTDIPTLIGGLEAAMSADERIHFVSTGGEIGGHCRDVYQNYLEMIDKSPFKARFHALGWIDIENVSDCYFESDMAVNIDQDIYESELGSRNRILAWLWARLPVITNDICELERDLAAAGAARAFRIGDKGGFAAAIRELAGNENLRKEMGETGQRYVKEHFSFGRVIEPTRAWARDLKPAPDLAAMRVKGKRHVNTLHEWTAFENISAAGDLHSQVEHEREWAENWSGKYHETKAMADRYEYELNQIRGKRIFRLYKWVQGIFKK